jgi:hypothetical protein
LLMQSIPLRSQTWVSSGLHSLHWVPEHAGSAAGHAVQLAPQ